MASLALAVLYGCICGIVVKKSLGADRSTSSDTQSKSYTARPVPDREFAVAGRTLSGAAPG
jgi:hypothetical protein